MPAKRRPNRAPGIVVARQLPHDASELRLAELEHLVDVVRPEGGEYRRVQSPVALLNVVKPLVC